LNVNPTNEVGPGPDRGGNPMIRSRPANPSSARSRAVINLDQAYLTVKPGKTFGLGRMG
jgi:hypothetical protein